MARANLFRTLTMLSVALTLCLVTQGSEADDMAAEMKKADPLTRASWACEAFGLKKIQTAKPKDNPHPDRLFLGPTTHSPSDEEVKPKLDGTTLVGGGMFRGDTGWTNITFTCQTTADHMKAQSFTFKLQDTQPW